MEREFECVEKVRVKRLRKEVTDEASSLRKPRGTVSQKY